MALGELISKMSYASPSWKLL